MLRKVLYIDFPKSSRKWIMQMCSIHIWNPHHWQSINFNVSIRHRDRHRDRYYRIGRYWFQWSVIGTKKPDRCISTWNSTLANFSKLYWYLLQTNVPLGMQKVYLIYLNIYSSPKRWSRWYLQNCSLLRVSISSRLLSNMWKSEVSHWLFPAANLYNLISHAE